MRPHLSKRLLKLSAGPVLGLAALVAGCEQTPMTFDPAISDDQPSSGAPWASAAPPSASSAASPSSAAAVAELARSLTARADVKIDNFTFDPPTLTVPVGTTVTWVNHDDVPHTVTATDKAFASKALDTDDRYSHAFTATGTFTYFCAVHPHMTGKIIVK